MTQQAPHPAQQEDAIDVRALRERAARDEVAARRAQAGEAAAEADPHVGSLRSRYGTFGVIGSVLVAGPIVIETIDGPEISPKFFGAVLAGILLIVQSLIVLRRYSWQAAHRISLFAEWNGLKFARWKQGAGGYTGMPFTFGHGHERLHVVSGARGGRPVEIGNLRYSSGSTRTFIRRCGYIAIRLPARMPHMVLDAGHSNGLLGLTLPNPPHSSHRIDVGAGRAFKLYAVDGAEQIVRSLFTTEVVALFQRLAKRFDMEFKDDVLFLYSRGDASTTSSRRWSSQLSRVDELAASAASWSVWDLARRQRRGRGPSYGTMRTSHVRQTVVPLIVVALVVAAILFVLLGGLEYVI